MIAGEGLLRERNRGALSRASWCLAFVPRAKRASWVSDDVQGLVRNALRAAVLKAVRERGPDLHFVAVLVSALVVFAGVRVLSFHRNSFRQNAAQAAVYGAEGAVLDLALRARFGSR